MAAARLVRRRVLVRMVIIVHAQRAMRLERSHPGAGRLSGWRAGAIVGTLILGRFAMDGVDYGSEEKTMQAYLRDGEKRAYALGNRGPIRFTAAGALHPDIVEAYWRCGFYIFEGVLRPEELDDIERDLHDILDRLPAEKGAAVDAKGRPALAADCAGPNLHWARPLSDPWGGTAAANGRHPVKMHEPQAAA